MEHPDDGRGRHTRLVLVPSTEICVCCDVRCIVPRRLAAAVCGRI